jgi:hypothetical protein
MATTSRVDQNNGSTGVALDDSDMRRTSSTNGTYDPSFAQAFNDLLHRKNELIAACLETQDENQTEYQVAENDDVSSCQKAGDCFRNLFSFSRKPKNP